MVGSLSQRARSAVRAENVTMRVGRITLDMNWVLEGDKVICRIPLK